MLARARREVEIFLTAVMFFTRCPVPKGIDHSEDKLNASARYFPWVGIGVGIWAALWTGVAGLILPLPLAVLLGLVATLWGTGAFHEDGLADTIDGFGGGYSRAKILEIMRDSRIGSFGATALVIALAIKVTSLIHLGWPLVLGALVAGHAWSRFVSVTIIRTDEYAREDGKAKPLATRISAGSLSVAAIGACLPLAALVSATGQVIFLLTVPTTFAARWWMARRFRARIGGYTGDCLGAVQQITEIVFYLTLVACVWKSS
jgi:adenosylcobinamide-GDP ribazoletransferase